MRGKPWGSEYTKRPGHFHTGHITASILSSWLPNWKMWHFKRSFLAAHIGKSGTVRDSQHLTLPSSSGGSWNKESAINPSSLWAQVPRSRLQESGRNSEFQEAPWFREPAGSLKPWQNSVLHAASAAEQSPLVRLGECYKASLITSQTD